jgi:hypothetical protein
MREYKPTVQNASSDNMFRIVVENFNAISSSIKSILTQARINKDSISANGVRIDNVTLQAWTTANRPTNTPNLVTMGINTTTGNINYTTDGGANWKNYDGTAA